MTCKLAKLTSTEKLCTCLLALCSLFAVGCSTSLSPPVPHGTSSGQTMTYRLSNLLSVHSSETRQYIESEYAHLLTNREAGPELEMTINCVERKTPDINTMFLAAFTLGLMPRHYEMTEQCDVRIVGTDGRILYTTSVRGTAHLSSWGYFALYGENYAKDSWSITPTEKRAELIAASSALEAVVRSDKQIAARLRQNTLETAALASLTTTAVPNDTTPPDIVDTSPGVGIALLIGINKYDTLGELDSCQQDAVATRETMVKYCGYNPSRVMLLTDNASTRERTASYANLTRRIDQACKLARPEDTLLIYFAGHGITVDNEMYLAPQDGDDPRTCISVTWLRQMMENSAATSKMLVLDACHSGKATRGVSGIVPSKFSKGGVLTLSSCADNELSYQENRHGVFTSYLLAGLEGPADADKDNQVNSRELFRFIQANMASWSMRSGKTQRPQISDETVNLILGRCAPRPQK